MHIRFEAKAFRMFLELRREVFETLFCSWEVTVVYPDS